MRANVKGPLTLVADLVFNMPLRLRRLRCRLSGHIPKEGVIYIVDGVKNRCCGRCGEPYAP